MMPANQPPCALVNDHASMNCGSRAGTSEYPAKPRISAAETPDTRAAERISVAGCFSGISRDRIPGADNFQAPQIRRAIVQGLLSVDLEVPRRSGKRPELAQPCGCRTYRRKPAIHPTRQ